MAGRIELTALLAGVGSGTTAIAAIWVGLIQPSEAACFAVGGAMASTILAAATVDLRDALHPARVQLARIRRTEGAANVLVAKLPAVGAGKGRRASRHRVREAAAVLRVTDGVAVVSTLRGYQLCAVIENGQPARLAIKRRLRNACGMDVRIGWASFPKDGVTLERLIAAASDRIPELARPQPEALLRPQPEAHKPQILPGGGAASPGLRHGRSPAGRPQ